MDDFRIAYPNLINILSAIDGILNSYKYLKEGDNFGSTFNDTLTFLKVLAYHKITLPGTKFIEQFPIKGKNILGKPIKIDEKLFEKLF